MAILKVIANNTLSMSLSSFLKNSIDNNKNPGRNSKSNIEINKFRICRVIFIIVRYSLAYLNYCNQFYGEKSFSCVAM